MMWFVVLNVGVGRKVGVWLGAAGSVVLTHGCAWYSHWDHREEPSFALDSKHP